MKWIIAVSDVAEIVKVKKKKVNSDERSKTYGINSRDEIVYRASWVLAMEKHEFLRPDSINMYLRHWYGSIVLALLFFFLVSTNLGQLVVLAENIQTTSA